MNGEEKPVRGIVVWVYGGKPLQFKCSASEKFMWWKSVAVFKEPQKGWINWSWIKKTRVNIELDYVEPSGSSWNFCFYAEKNKDLLEESGKRLVWSKLVINRIHLSDVLKIVSIETKVEER